MKAGDEIHRSDLFVSVDLPDRSIALITLMLQFYQELSVQIATHDETRYQMFSPMESNWIRLQDRVQQGIEGEGQEEID